MSMNIVGASLPRNTAPLGSEFSDVGDRRLMLDRDPGCKRLEL